MNAIARQYSIESTASGCDCPKTLILMESPVTGGSRVARATRQREREFANYLSSTEVLNLSRTRAFDGIQRRARMAKLPLPRAKRRIPKWLSAVLNACL